MPEPHQPAHAAPSDTPLGLLRRHLRGVVVADPLAVRVQFVIDPATGQPVVACRGDAGESEDWILFVPDEGDGALQVAGSPRALDPERDGVCDRWRAYHGTPEDGRFFLLEVEWGRWAGRMLEAEEVRRPSVAVGVEAKLLRRVNSTSGLAGRLAGLAATEGAVAVGVDESGVDVRAHHRVVRAEFASPAADAVAVVAAVDGLIERAGA